MFRKALLGCLAFTIGGCFGSAAATAAVPHTVLPGESWWSISAANNVSTQALAAFNGLDVTATLLAGTTIEVPTVGEDVEALAGAATATAPASVGLTPATTTSIVPAPGMGHIPSPFGELHLLPAAATAWNAMRAEALSAYGVDIYPGGPVSAYRTYEQQAELHRAFQAGYGAPANPPGSSSHELGTAVDVATPEMRRVIDQIGWKYGWTKVHAPGEWWHVDYVGG